MYAQALQLNEESIRITVWLQVKCFSLSIFPHSSLCPRVDFLLWILCLLPTAAQGNREEGVTASLCSFGFPELVMWWCESLYKVVSKNL